jgi:hypothetical protein
MAAKLSEAEIKQRVAAAQEWLENGGRADANPHFMEYVDRELSAGLIFQREQIQEMISRVGEAKAS